MNSSDLISRIPVEIRSPVLSVSSSEVVATENIPTIFIGIVANDFDRNLWKIYLSKIKKTFNVKDGTYVEIKAVPRQDSSRRIDDDKLGASVAAAMDELNKKSYTFLRIVNIGVYDSPAIFDALRSLLQGWNQHQAMKHIQLITMAESDGNSVLSFSKWACLTKICQSVQYVNMQNYDFYGQLNETYHTISRIKSLQTS